MAVERKLFWYPVGAEHATAEALVHRGLLRRIYGVGVTAYQITLEGERVGASL